MNQIKEYNETIFESIKHTNEYWLAWELMVVLEYKRWDKFNNVIDNAKSACEVIILLTTIFPKWEKW